MIEHVLCNDVENDLKYVEVRWNGIVFAEIWFERQRGDYAVAFYRTGSAEGPLENAPDLQPAIQALAHAQAMLAPNR